HEPAYYCTQYQDAAEPPVTLDQLVHPEWYDHAIANLVDCLRDATPAVRQLSCELLGQFGRVATDAATRPLQRLLRDPELRVRLAARPALTPIEQQPPWQPPQHTTPREAASA